MLYLEAQNGPLKNRKFPLRAPLLIGRKRADITIEDPRISLQHAKITKENGSLWIIDLNSRNGIKVNGQRTTKAQLLPGILFQLGPYFFKVLPPVETSQVKASQIEASLSRRDLKKGISKEDPDQTLPPENYQKTHPQEKDPKSSDPSPSEELPSSSWETQLYEFLTQLSVNEENHIHSKLKAFEKTCTLNFLQGLQQGTQYEIHYGPRSFGPQSLEFPIYDKTAPDICFSIIPKENGLLFFTQHPQQIHLNNQKKSSSLLRHNDIISFSQTRIKVTLQK